MKESELLNLGFNVSAKFKHDSFRTIRYKKGVLNVELTYQGSELLTTELTITELNCMPVSIETLKTLTPILGSVKSD